MRTLAGMRPQNPSDIAQSRGFVAGLMGVPEVGKTSSMMHLLPDYGPICVFNLDKGAHVLTDVPGQITVYSPPDWPTLDTALKELEKDPAPFKTIWTDRVNDMTNDIIDQHGVYDIPANDKRQRQIRYGDVNWDVMDYHRRLMKMAVKFDINVFFVYLETRPVVIEGSQNPIATRHIALSPNLSLQITGMLDMVFHFEKDLGPKPFPPIMRLYGDPTIETRLRLSPTNPLRKWPATVKNPSLTKVINAYKGEIYDGNFSAD